MDWSSAKEYVQLYKDLKTAIPQLKKSQAQPENPQSKDTAINFLWSVKQLYGKVKKTKKMDIPHLQFLENLDSLPDDKAAFATKVNENMLEVRNNMLHIKPAPGESEPIADFSSNLLNEIEHWGLALVGTLGKSKS